MARGPAFLLVSLFVLGAGCGAKTGLLVPDLGPEADAAEDLPADTLEDLPACVPFREVAELASLDLMLLVDTSGSMDDPLQPVAGSPTKAEAVSAAIEGFVRDEASEDVGVGLFLFPQVDEDVPEECVLDSQCGDEGVCRRLDLCSMGENNLCLEDQDCLVPGAVCRDLRRCTGRDNGLCFDDGGCPPGELCSRDFGFCENRVRCLPGDYRRPVVRLAELPGNADSVVTALEAIEPDGATPTAPALSGVIRRAQDRRQANPGNKVVVLLATDGFPTACDDAISPLDTDGSDGEGIPRVAEIASDGVLTGIDSYVIGVFQEDRRALAEANLSEIARAGGTDEAVIISTDEPVTERLREILDELRGAVQTCVYAIPDPGVLPDPGDLTVRLLAPGAEPEVLVPVSDAAACDPFAGGYFFDPSVEPGERPGFVELCPASCVPAARDDVAVEMQVGCDDDVI